jgi:hypothetical protein
MREFIGKAPVTKLVVFISLRQRDGRGLQETALNVLTGAREAGSSFREFALLRGLAGWQVGRLSTPIRFILSHPHPSQNREGGTRFSDY